MRMLIFLMCRSIGTAQSGRSVHEKVFSWYRVPFHYSLFMVHFRIFMDIIKSALSVFGLKAIFDIATQEQVVVNMNLTHVKAIIGGAPIA